MMVYVIELLGDVLGVMSDEQTARDLLKRVMVNRYPDKTLIEVQGCFHLGEPAIGDKLDGMIWSYELDNVQSLEDEIKRRDERRKALLGNED